MVHIALFWLAVATLVSLVAVAIEFVLGNRSLRHLLDIAPQTGDKPLKVSVIVAARNEARKIQPALQSLLQQDYPNIEFVVVDDRSTDDTGAILDRLAAGDSRVRVVHVRQLPKGWLGKNHAHHLGAGHATGEFLLFTDADVHMEETAIGRAVSYLQQSRLDHVAVAPQLTMPGTILEMFGGAFTIFFGLYAKPWKARDPKSKRFIGIGAFNLMRAEVYRAIGGYAPIAMRPDDDIKLGKLVKKSGYRQEMLLGDGTVKVEWYSSLGELVRGLEKNSFAGVEYSVAVIVVSTVAQLLVFVWPVIALAATRGPTRWLNAVILVVLAALYADNASFHGLKRWHWIAMPVTALLFLYIIWRATLKTLINDGIDWRGTHYSLGELKANKI
jgi:glycosyltransferase involved in cell wall biosynthesis